jgi:Holliday junction resolvase RusA-like endonuclease
MTTTITLDFLMPGLNGKDGLIREHFAKRKERMKSLQWQIKGAIAPKNPKHEGQVVIRYTRHTCTPMDWDNCCASFKLVGDAMVELGIITDDNPKVIVKFIPDQIKVSKRKEQKTVIEIEDFEE